MSANEKPRLGALVDPSVTPEPIENGVDPTEPVIGRWFWYTRRENVRHPKTGKTKEVMKRTLVCVTSLGSNYAGVTGIKGQNGEYESSYRDDEAEGSSWRILYTEWASCTTRELGAEEIFKAQIDKRQRSVAALLGKVKALTARLFVAPDGIEAVKNPVETGVGTALVTMQNAADPKLYKKALVTAKTTTLPDLFKQIENEHKQMARWMRAPLIALKAEAGKMSPIIQSIERRIFHVELYAGLIEDIVEVKDGEPAPSHEKVRLMQRRHYMDEECLLEYEAGGMDFRKIEAFDEWLARPANLTRLLPHPRCVVAFRVRRHAKDYDSDFDDWRELVQFHIGGEAAARKEANEWTYLYMRNGERVYRLSTGIEFKEELFPDLDQSVLSAVTKQEPIYATYDGDDIITESDYLQRCAKDALLDEQKVVAEAAWEAANKTCADCAKKNCSEHSWFHDYDYRHKDTKANFERVSTAWEYFDDVMKALKAQADELNRVVLVLQGIFDRSPVFNPHPPLRLWAEDFHKGVELVYDNARALAPGEKPDIDAFLAKNRAAIKVGDVTIGQMGAWYEARRELSDREKYSDRHSNDKGPGTLARVLKITGKGDDCVAHFGWTREPSYSTQQRYRELGGSAPDVVCRMTVPIVQLFSVNAYKPGAYKQFFADPRTRGDYMRWAWALLKSEDFAAGKCEVQEPPPEVLEPPKRHRDEDAAWARQRRNELQRYHDKVVKLARDVETRGHTTGPKGMLCRAHRHGGKLTVREIFLKDTKRDKETKKRGEIDYEGFNCRGLDVGDVYDNARALAPRGR